MYIDTHVHFRDFTERYKETVKHGLEVARDAGFDAVCDMPNTDPPIIDEGLYKMQTSLKSNTCFTWD
jgi:dihydroorotase